MSVIFLSQCFFVLFSLVLTATRYAVLISPLLCKREEALYYDIRNHIINSGSAHKLNTHIHDSLHTHTHTPSYPVIQTTITEIK